MSHISSIFPPDLPVRPIILHPNFLDSVIALITFGEFPLVEIATTTSPLLALASICLLKISS